MKHSSSRIATLACAVTALLLGCSKESPEAKDAGKSSVTTPPVAGGQHGVKVVDLGAGAAGPFKLTATRDIGVVEAGGEVPIDVRVATDDAANKVGAVRFWIGDASGVGSVKALAAIEDPKEPDRWHTHAEAPKTLVADAKLFVEVEDGAGAKHVASFELKR
jgi:hypothetical protein